MALSIAEVKKIASLARIGLSPEEEKRYTETISVVLDYMTILNEVNTDGIEITSQVTGLTDVFRDDISRNSGRQEKILGQMPMTELNELVVPEVFED
ncbi:MAG: Asp-tRNA(Asn)/Glu-tRNA(Gln) amidotransferase subunit GatC [Patescibacteria group bacterium]|jgi:aspartyl-tRNA(Asn)/glutamyl-tRNA(Gln) amidotransferase subunit C